MSRKKARENLFKLVFEYLFCGEKNELSLDSALVDADTDEKEYVTDLYDRIISDNDSIKELIMKFSHDFAYDRIYKVDLAILFVAVTEIVYSGLPYQICANEAIEIAKKYSTDKSAAFINGVLSGVIKENGGTDEGTYTRRKADSI